MDFNVLSISSDEDDLSTKSHLNLNAKSESDNEGTDLSSSTYERFNEDNGPHREKPIETGHSAEVTNASKTKVQREGTKIRGDKPSISSTDKDSVCNISLFVGDKTLKASQSMLSIDSTCGSSSSEHYSLEEEQSENIGEIRNVYRFQDDSETQAVAVSRFLPEASMYNSPFASSVLNVKLANRSQKLDCVFTAASGTSMVSDKSSDTKNLSIKNTSALPMVEKAPSKNTRDEEGCFATGGFYDHDHQTKDASVRRKVKAAPTASSGTYSLPSTSYAQSVSNPSTSTGLSLLCKTKPIEKIKENGENSQIYETFGKSHDVKYYTPIPLIRELSTSLQQIANAANKRSDTESLLKEVQLFFQNYHVEADVNLSWDENMEIILTSRYFSDAFAKRHGLLTCEELVEEQLEEINRLSSQLTNELSILQLCCTLKDSDIPEQEFVNWFQIRFYNHNFGMNWNFESSDRERREHVNSQLYFIETEVGFDVMFGLYKLLTTEGALDNYLTCEPEEPSAAEKRFQCLEISENPNQVFREFSEEDHSAPCTNYRLLDRTLLQIRLNDAEGPSSEGNMLTNEYATASSESIPNVLKPVEDEIEPFPQETPARRTRKWPDISDE